MRGVDVEKKDIKEEAKEQKISDRTLYIIKIKELIEAKKLVELSTFVG